MKPALTLAGLLCALLIASLAVGADPPVVNDGWDHGDPPFLLEVGWTPVFNGKNLDDWAYTDPQKGAWGTTRAVFWGAEANPQQLLALPEPGDRMINTVANGKSASNIYTKRKFGDVELYVEFMMAKGTNSGVYMHGLYETQIWDSYGTVPRLDTDRCGAMYHYNGGPIDGVDGGIVPRVRAERPAGQWQSYHYWFQAPRFDAAGKKVAPAKFLRIVFNGQVIHENVERLGPTVASMKIPEAAENPLMLQGDHGSVAYRNIYVRPLRPLTQK
jgi:hypothetical protein